MNLNIENLGLKILIWLWCSDMMQIVASCQSTTVNMYSIFIPIPASPISQHYVSILKKPLHCNSWANRHASGTVILKQTTFWQQLPSVMSQGTPPRKTLQEYRGSLLFLGGSWPLQVNVASFTADGSRRANNRSLLSTESTTTTMYTVKTEL